MVDLQAEINPPIVIDNDRIIRTVGGALGMLRDHEARPGVDDRDEVLHQLERVSSPEELAAAIARFRDWVTTWGVTIPVPSPPFPIR